MIAVALIAAVGLAAFTSGDGRDARASVDSELFVERVAGFDPIRVNVRCQRHLARNVLASIARVSGAEIVEIPEDFAGYVERVSLRNVTPDVAIDTVAGSLGYLTHVDGNRIRVVRPPAESTEEARAWYFDRAIERYETFLAFEGDHAEAPAAWLELARLREERGDPDGGIEALRSLREWTPSSPEAVAALVEIGRLQFLQGRIEDAVASLVEVIDRHGGHPACGDAYTLLGRCRLATDQVEMARRYFKIGIERFPKSPASISSRIFNVEVLRRVGEVELAWEEVADLEVERLTRGQALELLEVRSALEASTGYPSEAALGWLALASAERLPARRQRFLEDARRAAERAGDALGSLAIDLTLAPDSKGERIALWLVSQGFTEAALRFHPGDPEVMLRAARSRAAAGQLDRAQLLLTQTPVTVETASTRKLVQAEIALRSRRPEEVPGILLPYIEASSDKSFVLDALGLLSEAYLLTGNLGDAELSMQGIVPKEPRR